MIQSTPSAPHVVQPVPELPPPPAAPVAIPSGGARIIVDRLGNRTIFTTTAVPRDVMFVIKRTEETAFGIVGLLAVIIILGPFARLIARRMGNRAEVAGGMQAQLLQQQLHELQQSMDTMSVEIERISESQRFQSKLLNDKRIV